MERPRFFSFTRARRPGDLPGIGRRALFYVWNLLVLLLSSAGVCVLSLNFAIGVYDWGTFFGYFTHPLIFLLNWIPILLLQLLLLCLFNRQWAAFLVSSLLILLPSIGNFFKLKFRDEPFVFRDVSSIRAGLSVADSYGVSLNGRIVLAAVLVLAGTVFLLLFARGRLWKGTRIGAAVLSLLAVWPLWHFVYSQDELYYKTANENLILETWASQEYFIANGFAYPFLHSITESKDLPPEGYDAKAAAALLAAYSDGDIPEDRKVDLLVIQLESFADLEELGVTGITPDTYAPLRQLQQESICGTLIPNIIGGGTIDTERCFLSGSYGLQNYTGAAPSYVRCLNDQGYRSTGSHPNRAFFYNRANVAEYLGFDEYFFLDNHYYDVTGGEWRCDGSYLPEVFRMFREYVAEDAPVFSFNVTLQGHGPYNAESYDTDRICWPNDTVSDSTRYAVNNYLSLIAETQEILLRQIDTLRDSPEPMVLLLYGDHKPWLESEVYEELGIHFDLSTEQGMRDYYATPYLIWANDAAKDLLELDFTGEAPTVSPGYLMNVLFEVLGWKGPAFMQFTDSIMEHMPVVHSGHYYIEDGVYTREPDAAGRALLRDYEWAQFYLRGSLR